MTPGKDFMTGQWGLHRESKGRDIYCLQVVRNSLKLETGMVPSKVKKLFIEIISDCTYKRNFPGGKTQ